MTPSLPPHAEAIYQAILDSCDDDDEDDFQRLVFADWLDDGGDPDRAEFIRIQCRLARLTSGDSERAQLARRERDLLERHQDEWLGPELRPLLSAWTFRRGFLEAVSVPADVYLEHPAPPYPGTVRHVEVDLTGLEVPAGILEYVPESVAKECWMLPLGFRGWSLVLAMRDPTSFLTIAKLEFIFNRPVEPIGAAATQIAEAVNRHYPDTGFMPDLLLS